MQNIPNWFWIGLLVIAAIFVACFVMSKKPSLDRRSLSEDGEPLGPLNAIDDVNSLQNAI